MLVANLWYRLWKIILHSFLNDCIKNITWLLSLMHIEANTGYPLALVLHIIIKHNIPWKKVAIDNNIRLRAAFMRLAPPQKEFSLSNSWIITIKWKLVAIMTLSHIIMELWVHKTWVEWLNNHQKYLVFLFTIVE